jgi:hypothetical protein
MTLAKQKGHAQDHAGRHPRSNDPNDRTGARAETRGVIFFFPWNGIGGMKSRKVRIAHIDLSCFLPITLSREPHR